MNSEKHLSRNWLGQILAGLSRLCTPEVLGVIGYVTLVIFQP
jgi:hypothetical protein